MEKTKVDGRAMKVTVEGKVDPAKLREKLQEKTKKKVELVSPLPKKEKDQANKEKKEKPKEVNRLFLFFFFSIKCTSSMNMS